MPLRILTRAFETSKAPRSAWDLRCCRLFIWLFPFLIGSLLGLRSVMLLYPAGSTPLKDLLVVFVSLATWGLIWLKRPWARQRPAALFFACVAGYGAMVAGILLAVRFVIHIDFGASMPLVTAAGVVLFIGGVYYAQLFRLQRRDEQPQNGAG